MLQSRADWPEPFKSEPWIALTRSVDYRYMWQSPMGTYEAQSPQNFQDKCVARRETVTIEGDLYGEFRERGVVTVSSGLTTTHVVERTEGQWVFFE